MKREDRFIGHGNFACGDGHNRVKAWKITCSTCPSIKMITMPTGALPPDAVLELLIRSGWEIGKKPDRDFCPSCVVRKRDQKERGETKKINAPVLNGNLAENVQRERSFICAIHSLLLDGQIDQAIERIETHLPMAGLRRRRPPIFESQEASQIKEPDIDFNEWLAEQEFRLNRRGRLMKRSDGRTQRIRNGLLSRC